MNANVSTLILSSCHHTWIVDVFFKLKLHIFVCCTIVVGIITIVTTGGIDVNCEVTKQPWWHENTLLSQVPHEELETNQGKDTKTKHSQDHGISQLLH